MRNDREGAWDVATAMLPEPGVYELLVEADGNLPAGHLETNLQEGVGPTTLGVLGRLAIAASGVALAIAWWRPRSAGDDDRRDVTT